MTSFPAPTRSAALPRRALARAAVATVLALGVLASSLVAAGPAAAATVPRPTVVERLLDSVIGTLINVERRAHHLPALHMNAKLQLSARRHNLTMARRNTMSHQLPGEAFFGTRISRAGYHWHWAGENIAWNSAMTRAGVVYLEKYMYAERPPENSHRLNILNRHYRDVGVDIYFDRKHHKLWLTTDFGRA